MVFGLYDGNGDAENTVVLLLVYLFIFVQLVYLSLCFTETLKLDLWERTVKKFTSDLIY